MLETRTLVSILGVPLLALLIACGDEDGSGDSSSSDTGEAPAATSTAGRVSTPAATASAASSGGGGALSEAEATALSTAFAQLKSFKAVMTIEETGQTSLEMRMEYAAPDKLYMTFPAVVFGTTGGPVELIAIGSTQYLRPAGGQWNKIDLIPVLGFEPAEIPDFVGDFSGAKKGGTDTVNGKMCQIYTSAGNELCVADNLPLRLVQNDALRGSREGKLTIIFTEYNSNVDIKAPI